MIKPPAQKAKLMFSLAFFVLGVFVPVFYWLYVYFRFGQMANINYIFTIGWLTHQFMPITTLFWIVGAFIVPTLWLRIVMILFCIYGVGFSSWFLLVWIGQLH
jgi:hypothetical protein